MADRQPNGTWRASGAVEGIEGGCLPDRYAALAHDPSDQVVTL